MWWVALVLLAGLATAPAADARQHYPARGHRIMPAENGPLAAFSRPAAAYSFRRLFSAYAGPALRIRRASDSLEADINFLGFVPGIGAPIDTAAINAHCAATTCTVVTWYDQSGNGRDKTNATPANQPAANLSCILSGPCARTTAATTLLTGPTYTATTTSQSVAVVGRRVSAAGACIFLRNGNNNRIDGLSASANTWELGNGAMTAAATDNVFHSAIGALAPGAGQTTFRIDATETTGTGAPSLTAATIQMVGAAATTCDHVEAIYWDAQTLSPAERTALQQNQKSYWGTP